MTSESYEPVFLPNQAVMSKKYKVGDIVKMRVTEVMDDGVKAMCDHGRAPMTPPSNGRKEVSEHVTTRYKEAMAGKAGL